MKTVGLSIFLLWNPLFRFVCELQKPDNLKLVLNASLPYGQAFVILLQIIDKMIWGINMNKRIDKLLYIDILILVAIGLLMVYSASNVVAKFKYNDAGYYFKRQLLFACLGLIGCILRCVLIS